MSSLNKVMLIGRIGQDPEIKTTQSNTSVATISIATSSRFQDAAGEWQETTEWHRVVAWGKKAEVFRDYTKKGSLVYVEGPLQTRSWEKDGVTRYTTEIKALQIVLLDSKGDGNNAGSGASKPAKSSGPNVEISSNFDDMDDDLPF